jgi:bifunctional DNase/RNase
MTHDLLKNVLNDLEARVQKIVVSELRDNTFYAMIYINKNENILAIDSRPSDAIALALRTKSPIFVEESVVESAKGMDLTKDTTDSERLQKWLESLNPEDLGKYKM